MLVVILRRKRIALIGRYFAVATLASVNAGERHSGAGRIDFVEGFTLRLFEILLVFI
jgi:hypothetical protein